MTKSLPKPKTKTSMNRGAKVLLASLSIATTIGGWALLTLNESTANAEQDAQDTETEIVIPPTQIPLQTVQGVTNIALAPLPTATLPALSRLPVRGLRHVGDPTVVPPTVFVPQPTPSQDTAPRDRNNGGGGSSVSEPPPQSQPQPQQQPPPAPKPKPRKTKSSK